MPLLTDVAVTGNEVTWTYIHIWRVADGRVVEHWACRDDVGLLRQVGGWTTAPTSNPPNPPSTFYFLHARIPGPPATDRAVTFQPRITQVWRAWGGMGGPCWNGTYIAAACGEFDEVALG